MEGAPAGRGLDQQPARRARGGAAPVIDQPTNQSIDQIQPPEHVPGAHRVGIGSSAAHARSRPPPPPKPEAGQRKDGTKPNQTVLTIDVLVICDQFFTCIE